MVEKIFTLGAKSFFGEKKSCVQECVSGSGFGKRFRNDPGVVFEDSVPRIDFGCVFIESKGRERTGFRFAVLERLNMTYVIRRS